MRNVRIGAGQGFYGDSADGALAVAERGDVSYICCDALAELTMAILARDRAKDPATGYARDLPNFMRTLLPICQTRNIKIITNAGGMNPLAAARAVASTARDLGINGLRVAAVTGDDLLPQIDDLAARNDFSNMDTGEPFAAVRDRLIFAAAYLGIEALVGALRAGADVVVSGRVADASLFLAPMVHELGWDITDWNRMASGVVLGHLMECSAQATGGNFGGDWRAIEGLDHAGYPICDMSEDGTAILGKPAGSGGTVSIDTVKQQLLYEVMDPRAYMNPDVIADFTTVRMEEIAHDQVRIAGVQGRARPPHLKFMAGYLNGWLGVTSLSYAWPDAYAKAQRAAALLEAMWERSGLKPEETHVEYFGVNAAHGAAAPIPEHMNEVALRIAARFHGEQEAARFSRLATPLALNGPPFICGGGIPDRPRPLIGGWPALIPREDLAPEVVMVEAETA